MAGDGEPPLRLSDILALVDEAERARLAGDEEAFAIAASAAVAALDTSATEDDRRAAFEVTARLFAWAQPAQPLADLEALAAQEGEGRPWALRALGVARASGGDAEAAQTVADTLVAGYAGGEHARFGYALAVHVAVAEEDEAGAVSALLALVSVFPEAEELGPLAALVAGAFPDADLSGMEGRHGGGGSPPFAEASATTSGAPSALLVVGVARPNPSPSGALIPFELSGEARVEAVLYDVLGRRLAVLASGAFPAGRHTLAVNGALAERLPSGTYVVYVTARRGAEPTERAILRLTLTH